MSNYRKAPTWLYNKEGDSKLYNSQEEVDTAWDNGWFGPSNYLEQSPPISEQEFDTKALMEEAMKADPRYEGCKINVSQSLKNCLERIMAFEVENDIIDPE